MSELPIITAIIGILAALVFPAPSGMSGCTIHAGGRCGVFLDGNVQFITDSWTPL